MMKSATSTDRTVKALGPSSSSGLLFVVDIGNTNLVCGAFRGEELLFELRLKTDLGRTADEYSAFFTTMGALRLDKDSRFSRCVISSVVPPVTGEVVGAIREAFGLEPLVVGPGIKTGIQIKVNEPHAVGSDRVVNAVAARHLFGTPALIIDFGTATSFDIVNADGDYEGGVIAPGPRVAMDALVQNTAKLPRIELSWPKTTLGKSTIQAMQSGCVIGYACMVDGLIDRLQAELGPFAHVIATGGLGKLFTEHSTKIGTHRPHLTLEGLRIIAEMNEA